MKIVLQTPEKKRVTLHADVARNALAHALGLMFRSRLAKNSGMLFVFPGEARRSLWMLFTFIPLEALFFGAQGRLQEIVSMQPGSTKTYRSTHPARYVLEVNQGFSKRWNIRPGSRLHWK